MNKNELLDALEDGREAFLDLLDDIPQEDWEQPGVMQEWSIKDILYHLTMWEAELVKLLWQISQEQPPANALVSKVSDDERNAQWFVQSQNRSLERVVQDYQGVRKQTIRRLKEIPDKTLSDARRFPWLKNEPLWKWIAESSFLHEAEHAGAIQNWRNKQRPANDDRI